MSDFANAFRVQRRVIYAFILRETRTRFGRSKLGYFWAFFEPMAYLLTLVGIFSLAGRDSPLPVGINLFFFSGIIPWLLFSRCVNMAGGAIEANKALMTYPQVKVLDIVIARVILEFFTLLVVAILYLAAMYYWTGVFEPIQSTLSVLAALCIATLLGAGLGLCSGIIKLYLPSFGNFLNALMRVFFFTSGVFFIASGLPNTLVKWLAYNPLLHVSEWLRSAFFYDYESEFYDISYPVILALCLILTGMASERLSRYKLRDI